MSGCLESPLTGQSCPIEKTDNQDNSDPLLGFCRKLFAVGNVVVCDSPELTLPHPRLAERRFYLEPLVRIAADLRVPPGGTTVGELADAGTAVGDVLEVPWSVSPTDDRRGI